MTRLEGEATLMQASRWNTLCGMSLVYFALCHTQVCLPGKAQRISSSNLAIGRHVGDGEDA
jgi:hypothetical protein